MANVSLTCSISDNGSNHAKPLSNSKLTVVARFKKSHKLGTHFQHGHNL